MDGLIDMLNSINPAKLNYDEWLAVGMALKNEGRTCAVWHEWSKNDSRFKDGECFKKWDSFDRSGRDVVTGATICKFAKQQGWKSRSSEIIGWDDIITADSEDDAYIINDDWLEDVEIVHPEADSFDSVKEIKTYVETLFEPDECVGYVVKAMDKDGKYIPADRGSYVRTAGQLCEELNTCKGDIGAVLGDYDPNAGAWIRFNPLDGKGVKDLNVTAYRHALVECDKQEVEKQRAIIEKMELPVACMVFSGSKSIHAIVKIDAADYTEYKKRVNFLHDVCKKNGLDIDTANKNPSRLSRLPGVKRGDKMQHIIATNIGKSSWDEWKEWIDSVNDDLPDEESLADRWDNLPPLSKPLIDGILRQGHKMLIAGPSKAGKSFALIELCIAIAEGKKWLGFQCLKQRVLYVNLELDSASCLHRFKDVYSALGYKPKNIKSIDIWNLRGHSAPMDKLAPKLIRRAIKKDYGAIIIDPIYKVITGDENSADQMAHFCNQFDLLCNELGCAVIYCHHHSKGYQGGKRSMDRASGSGVFARDPDAAIDLIELAISEENLQKEISRAVKNTVLEGLDRNLSENWAEDEKPEVLSSEKALLNIAEQLCKKDEYERIVNEMAETKDRITARTAWRLEGTLREFPRLEPVNVWFDYPIHNVDEDGILDEAEAAGEQTPWIKAIAAREPKEKRVEKRKSDIESAFNTLSIEPPVTIKKLMDYMELCENAVRKRLSEHGCFEVKYGEVRRINDEN